MLSFVFFQQAPIIFYASLYFLTPHSVLGTSCIFSAPALESTTSPLRPGSFYWRKLFLETKIWALFVLITTGMPLMLGPLRE